jgi:hypothetical protein
MKTKLLESNCPLGLALFVSRGEISSGINQVTAPLLYQMLSSVSSINIRVFLNSGTLGIFGGP